MSKKPGPLVAGVSSYLLSFGLIVVMCVCARTAHAGENVAGYFTTRAGNTYNFIGLDSRNRTISFRYGPEQKSSSLSFSVISKIVFGEAGKSAQLQLKDGRKIDCIPRRTLKSGPYWEGSGNSWYTREQNFDIFQFDDVAGKKSTRSFSYNGISIIQFDQNVGRFRRCTHCKDLWPDSYLFCPHDGLSTVWGEASGSLRVKSEGTEEQHQEREGRVIKAIMNAALTKQGCAPDSTEADMAKEFAVLWMNPVSSNDDIQTKLNELRDSILKTPQE